uniref:small ribosomal subunit protein mS23 isoform X1 n=1 Tax=Myxine glutinosa TaxID=7769 RepID=UPI00358F5E69
MSWYTRMYKVGSIYSRIQGLMRAGVLKYENRPLWFDVYKAFPPECEPLYQKRPLDEDKDDVREILYPEDEIRAISQKFVDGFGRNLVYRIFFATYGNGPKAYDLTNPKFVSSCQRFVNKYQELEKAGEHSTDTLFEVTIRALLTEGVLLRRRGFSTAHAKAKVLGNAKNEDEEVLG